MAMESDDVFHLLNYANRLGQRSQPLFDFFFAMKRLCLVVAIASGLSGCRCAERLSAFSEYVVTEDLASYRIGTPDPSLACPTVGQRIFIKWALPKNYEGQELVCKLYLRFRDRSEALETIELQGISGVYVYSLLNEAFFAHGGIQTYKLDLLADGILIEEWRHQMWVELITFPDGNNVN